MKYKLSQYCIEISQDKDIILFNSVTGGISKLEKTAYEFLRNHQYFEEDIPYFEILKKEQFIVPWSKNEFNALRYKEIQAQHDISAIDSLTFVIAPTTACNLRCIYCFEHEQHVTDKPSAAIVSNISKFIVKQCESINSVKKVYITWFGGEPMLCFDEMVAIGQLLKEELEERKIILDSRIITNGILLSLEKVKLLQKSCNLTSAQITIDGLREEYCRKKRASSSDFERVIKNVCEIYQDIDVCIRLNADKTNLGDIYALADMLYSEFGLKDKLKLYFAMLRDYSKGSLKDIEFFSRGISRRKKEVLPLLDR